MYKENNTKRNIYYLILLTINICNIGCSKSYKSGLDNKPNVGNIDTVSAIASDSTAPGWPSPKGDVVGKTTVGYQGWFACIGDNSPIDGWWHWSNDWSSAPSPSNISAISWPDMTEYAHSYPSGFASLNNGKPAALFSSFDDQTVDVQFSWMQNYGIDCAALQRFDPNGIEGPIRDSMAIKVEKAAEKHNVKFYIMYDVTGWSNMQSEIKTDWSNVMKPLTNSSAYAMQNGKPVVCIWGFGFNDGNHNFTTDQCIEVINWFKQQGCYVIGGVPTHWLSEDQDSYPDYLSVYKDFNMISPWMVGRITKQSPSDNLVSEEDNFCETVNAPDLNYCRKNGIDYQPCVLPGNLQNGDRMHGDFMWEQFYNMTKIGVQGIYISMFDEYNEGNQIAKTAPTQQYVPSNGNFKSLDEDGTPCSSDYYLRLTQDGDKMFKGQTPLTQTRPTNPSL